MTTQHIPASQRLSNVPPLWLLFGAGGMMSALFGTALVLMIAFALPAGTGVFAALGNHERMLSIVQQPLVALVLLGLIVLFLWHAMHRLYKCLHDFGIHPSFLSRMSCYGVAALFSLVALWATLRLYC